MKKKSPDQIRIKVKKLRPFIPLIMAIVIGIALLGMTRMASGFTNLQSVTSASAQMPTLYRSPETQVMCPQVMYTCPNGNSVPLLPEYMCKPQCTNMITPTARPEDPRRPRPTRKPRTTPAPIATSMPQPVATTDVAVCPKQAIPDIYCLGGMPLELDPVTCTYKCQDYRNLQQ